MTLYALLSMLDPASLVAASIEDPVEYNLSGVRQVEVDEEHGLTMYVGLRSLLRMDIDVIMVGEIRDKHSAVAAVRAAASGHLVLTTIHAYDAAMAVDMFSHYEVPRHLLSRTLRVISSQDLVRRLCPECAGKRTIEDHEAEMFREANEDVPEEVPISRGCSACHHIGFKGRVGVFQVVAVDAGLSKAIRGGQAPQQVRNRIAQKGVGSLLADGLKKVKAGVTSITEMSLLHRGEA